MLDTTGAGSSHVSWNQSFLQPRTLYTHVYNTVITYQWREMYCMRRPNKVRRKTRTQAMLVNFSATDS